MNGRLVIDQSAPWYERAFMEVDWSKNIFESPTFAGGFGFFPFLNQTATVGTVDAGNAHRDSFTVRYSSAGSIDYFDFVNRLHVEPQHEIVGEGLSAQKDYQCGYARACDGAEIAVRVAYRRADRESEYEPRSYERDEQSRFPVFRTERVGFDPFIGGAVAKRVRLAQQIPLWKTSLQRDKDGVIARDDAGEPLRIPYGEREIEPIVFYLTGEWPDDLIDDVGAALDGYDNVMRESVAFLRQTTTESEPTGIVQLDFNGRVKHVAIGSAGAECDALRSRGAAQRGTLSTGEDACEITRYIPGIAPSFFGQDVVATWTFESKDHVAVLGDLLHHKIHWGLTDRSAMGRALSTQKRAWSSPGWPRSTATR